MLVKISFKGLIICLSIFLLNTEIAVSQTESNDNWDSVWKVEKKYQDSIQIVNTTLVNSRTMLQNYIIAKESEKNQVDSIISSEHSLDQAIKQQKVILAQYEETLKEYEIKNVLPPDSMRIGESLDSTISRLETATTKLEAEMLQKREKLETDSAYATELKEHIDNKELFIEKVQKEINIQLKNDSTSIAKYQEAILAALAQEDYVGVGNNANTLKRIVSNHFYTTENWYAAIRMETEEYHKVSHAILEADKVLNQKYNHQEVNKALTGIKSVLALQAIKEKAKTTNKVNQLIGLLDQYCSINNEAFYIADDSILNFKLYEKELSFIAKLKHNYPYLYSIFRNEDDTNILTKHSNNPLIRHDICQK